MRRLPPKSFPTENIRRIQLRTPSMPRTGVVCSRGFGGSCKDNLNFAVEVSFTFGHKTESSYLIWRASTSGRRHKTQHRFRLEKGAQRVNGDMRGPQECRGSMMAAKRTIVLFLEVGLEFSRNRFGFFRGSTKALFGRQGCQPWFYRLPPVGPVFFPTTRLSGRCARCGQAP